MAHFTPGPWIWLGVQRSTYLVPASHKARALGFSIYEKQNRDHYALVIAEPGTWGWASPDERAANYALIAAAPDLYAALERLINAANSLADDANRSSADEAIDAARVALAKATPAEFGNIGADGVQS